MTVIRTLLEITAYSAVLLGAILLFRAVFIKHASPAMLYAVWFILIARLLMPVTIGGISLIVLPAQDMAAPVQQAGLPALTGEERESNAFPLTSAIAAESDEFTSLPVQGQAAQTGGDTADAVRNTAWRWNWETVLILLWITGAFVILANTEVTFLRLRKKLSIAAALPDEWHEVAQRIKRELGIRGRVRFVMKADFASPALSASLRPIIVLPMEMMWQEDEAVIEFALRHELTHIKRGDHLVCLLLALLKAVYWFNPVVWIASRMMKMDMETACDSMVTRQMDGELKKQYAATIINMYAKAQPRFVLGMALGHTRQTAERRVRGIFMKRRSRKGAIATALLLSIVMAVACFTTACQPIQETAKISGEDNPPQASAAVKMPSPAQTFVPQPSAVQQPAQSEKTMKVPLAVYKTTGHWTGSYEHEGSILKVKADADIIMPDVDAYSIYNINPLGKITQSMADKMIRLLFGNTQVYEYNGQATQEDLQKQIDKLSGIYQTMQNDTFDFSQYNSNKKDMMDGLKIEISRLKSNMKDASKATAPVPLTGFKTDPMGEEWLRGEADLGEENKAEIIIDNGFNNSRDNGNDAFIVRFDNGGSYVLNVKESLAAPIGNLTIAENDAVRKAEDFLDDLGLTDYQLYSSCVAERSNGYYEISTGKYAYVLTYSRVVDGIAVSPNSTIPMIGTMAYNPEHITFAIDNDGIKQFDWEYKFDIDNAAPKNVNLLPVEKIEDIISKHLFEVNTDYMKHIDDGQGKGFKTKEYIYNLNAIKLEYAKLPDGDLNDYRLVPVWNVYATTDWNYTKTVNGEKVTKISKYNRQMVVLTVNAVDGSVVKSSFRA